jgi:tetratricopeptide (TPR) repeat protein
MKEMFMSVSSAPGRQGVVAVLLLMLAGASFAQAPTDDMPKNLTVLPKDWTRPRVVLVMQDFTTALGVTCEYCHTVGARPDFASDDKKEKEKARAMMKITRDLNDRLPRDFGVSASDVTRIGCFTCHRGVQQPKPLAEILAKTSAEKGFAAAATQYNELKSRYYGAQAYDFSDSGLIATATLLIQTRPDDAIQFLQLNLDTFPKSVRSYITLAQAQQAKKDLPAAIASLEKALAIDPKNNQAQRALTALKK